ncbi:hypothetical protein GGD64_003350 [Bradyrhizobium sp. CIR3A]|nr:hypothetical protein [Bradyrhizobium sp. CIR3A]NYG44048.1 hypothetical protein [Bradyrhizobium sp. IAR9]
MPTFEPRPGRPLEGGSPEKASRAGVRAQKAPRVGPAEITNSWTGEALSMSLECRRKAASSARSPSSDPMKTAGSPHWHPCDSSLSLIRTPRDCGSSTAPVIEKVSRTAGGRGPPERVLQAASCREGTVSRPPKPSPSTLCRSRPARQSTRQAVPHVASQVARQIACQVASQSPPTTPPRSAPEPPGAQTFFKFFHRPDRIGASAVLVTAWKHVVFRDNPPCDDLLTMGVDNPECGGL